MICLDVKQVKQRKAVGQYPLTAIYVIFSSKLHVAGGQGWMDSSPLVVFRCTITGNKRDPTRVEGIPQCTYKGIRKR